MDQKVESGKKGQDCARMWMKCHEVPWSAQDWATRNCQMQRKTMQRKRCLTFEIRSLSHWNPETHFHVLHCSTVKSVKHMAYALHVSHAFKMSTGTRGQQAGSCNFSPKSAHCLSDRMGVLMGAIETDANVCCFHQNRKSNHIISISSAIDVTLPPCDPAYQLCQGTSVEPLKKTPAACGIF